MQLVTFDNVKIYFGTYVFFKRDALPVTDVIAWFVEIDKKSNSIFPVNKYTGKFSILWLNIVENTIVMIIITNSGFNTLHK